MLKHKSFILNYGKPSKARAKVMSMSEKQIIGLEPELATKKEVVIVSHYDSNEPISLSLPHSLDLIQDISNDEDYEDVKNNQVSESQSYEYHTDEDDDFSEANAYFHKDNSYTEAHSYQLSSEDSNIENTAEKEDDEHIESHEAVVVNPEDILDDSSIQEQDQKFEEDIKAILTGKKQFDKARIQKNPEEALKDKNHGLMDKNSSQAIEDKLKNDHAIFDKIAQSMNMASSYDLGSIAMDKKFDVLEKETDTDFTKKIHDLLDKDKEDTDKDLNKSEGTDKIETNDIDTLKKAAKSIQNDDDKVETKDFLNDLDELKSMKFDEKAKGMNELSMQSSFNSTISIRHRFLKSRVFEVSGSTVEVMIDSHWTPTDCAELKDLNVTLMKLTEWYRPDSEEGTVKFRIGEAYTSTWNNIEPGNYYLVFFFVNDTNPNCVLKGTIEVKA